MSDVNFWAILERGGYSRKRCAVIAEDAGLCLITLATARGEESGVGIEDEDHGFDDKERMLAAERLTLLSEELVRQDKIIAPGNDVPTLILRRHAPPPGEVLRIYLMRLLQALRGRPVH